MSDDLKMIRRLRQQSRFLYVFTALVNLYACVVSPPYVAWINALIEVFWFFAPCCDPVFGNRGRLHWMRQTLFGGCAVLGGGILLVRA